MSKQKKIFFSWEIIYNFKGQIIIKKRFITLNTFIYYKSL